MGYREQRKYKTCDQREENQNLRETAKNPGQKREDRRHDRVRDQYDHCHESEELSASFLRNKFHRDGHEGRAQKHERKTVQDADKQHGPEIMGKGVQRKGTDQKHCAEIEETVGIARVEKGADNRSHN